MSRLAKAAAFSPKAQFSDQLKIVNPQKVELAFNKPSSQPKVAQSNSYNNLDAGWPQAGKIKFHKPDQYEDRQLAGYLDLDHEHQRPETTNEGLKSGSPFKGDKRPATTIDGFGRKQLKSQERGEFKIRKMARMGSMFPTAKIGGAGNLANAQNADMEMLVETTKEDREAVEELERWDNEYKVMALSKVMENDQKKAKESQKQYQESTETYKTPFLNREMIDLIDMEGFEKDGKHMTAMANLNKQKSRVPQKSLETIMTEYNKKILNDILYTRVSKQMLGTNNKETQNQKKLDLDYATKSVSTDTVNNFKNLQHTIQTNPRIIEYDQLYQKLTIQKNLPEKVFDFDEDRKRLLDAENDYASIETGLKTQFELVIAEIHKKKDALNDLRLIIHNNNDEIKATEEEIDEMNKKYRLLENQYNQQTNFNRSMIRSNNRKQRGPKDSSRGAGVEEYSKAQRQMEDKMDQINSLRERIGALQNETQKSQQKLTNLEREIKDLKFKKNQLRLQLKQLYAKILKNEEHIFQNEASFITIIKNMWRINEEVLEDMFPPFVDKESLSFLIENARLEFELEQLENLSKTEQAKGLHKSDYHQDDVYSRFLKTQNSLKVPLSEQLSDVKQRLQNLKKGIVKMKRPVFIKDGTARSRMIRWEELNLESEDLSEPHVTEHFIQEKINRAVLSIKAKIADLKEKEINRIFSLYINKEIEEKSLKNLNKILLSLFGKQNAEKIYLRFVRLKQAHDFKITQNKTFVFSSTKQFSNSILGGKTRDSYTLMLSYASHFRPVKTAGTLPTEKTVETENKKEILKKYEKELGEFNAVDNLEVNFNYNLNFNYAPELQSNDPHSKFYVSKYASSGLSSAKSSMKNLNQNKMSKTGSSFNKVTFDESKIPNAEPTNIRGSMQSYSSERKFLRSAL